MTFRDIFDKAVFAIGFTQISLVLGAPLVQNLGVDITILTDNDLIGKTTTRTSGAILLGPEIAYKNAQETCAKLNENLWSPQSGDFNAGLNNSLSYHVYDSKNTKAPSGLYWITSTGNNSSCSAISAKGKIEKVSCNKLLPALCTQKAPMSVPARANTSVTYQVSQTVGKQVLTGFRDFHTFRFHGIRFAPEPKRFEFSTLYEGEGSVDATKYGYDCVQGPMPYLGEMREDCLFLNIWTPFLPSKPSHSSTKKKLKPVMFWVYGGGNVEGSGTDPEKEGGSLASRGDVVVVEFNYRLGALGWLAFNDGVHNGNYGLSDQLNALRWTHKHIRAFGGDPDQITIFGNSAGGIGIRQLLTTPHADGLFANAMIQSAPAGFLDGGFWLNNSRPEKLYQAFTKKILAENGCSNSTDEVACMRAGNPHEWAQAGRTMANYQSRDGKLVTYNNIPLGPRAKRRNINLAIGTTRDEAVGWIPTTLPPTFSQVTAGLSAYVNYNLSKLNDLAIFNPELSPGWSKLSEAEKKAEIFNAVQKIATDGFMTCYATGVAYSAAKNRLFKSVYQYEFNRTYIADNTEASPESKRICGLYVTNPDRDEYFKCHGTDNPTILGNIGFLGYADRDGTDILYTRNVVDYWTSFARNGKMDPDVAYLKARGYWTTEQQLRRTGSWKEFNAKKPNAMSLQWTGQKMFDWPETRKERCSVLGYPWDYYEKFDYES